MKIPFKWIRRLLPFKSVSEKILKTTVSTGRNKIFSNIGLPLMTVMVSKNMDMNIVPIKQKTRCH